MHSIIISFNMCALIIAVSLLAIFLIRQPLMIFQDKVYLNLIITTVLVDMAAVAANPTIISNGTVLFALRSIIVALLFYEMVLWTVYFAALFNFKLRLSKVRPVIIISILAISLLIAINTFTKCFFYINSLLEYIETPLFKTLYTIILTATFITSTCIFIPARMYTSLENVFLYIFVLISCLSTVIVEYFYPNEDFFQLAVTISIVSIYFTVQAPETYIDSMTGLLNEDAFNKLCAKKISGKRNTYCIAICLHDARIVTAFVNRDRTELVTEIRKKTFGMLLKNSLIFKFFPGGYLIVLDKEDEDYANAVLKKAHEFFSNFRTGPDQTVLVPTTVSLICCPKQASSTEEIKSYLDHILDRGIEENLSLVKSEDLPVENIHFIYKTQNHLKDAEEEGRLKVLYQPIYSIKTKSYDTAEALLRMTDERGNFISPTVFIPLAERNGSILDLGKFMLNEVCRTFSERHLRSYGLQNISVNLSPVECIQDNLKDKINGILKRYSLQKSCISIEITETATGLATEAFNANIRSLALDGYNICLDNLGTGNSSVKKLMSLPFHTVKIDKSIVIPAFSGGEKERILFDAILDITHIFSSKVVIQGIETEEGANAASKLNADYIQGYYYSTPLEEDQFEEFLKKNRLPGSI